MGVIGGRTFSLAKIEGMGIAVQAEIRKDQVEYTALSDGYGAQEFGPFGRIVVRRGRIECNALEGEAVQLDAGTRHDLLTFLDMGDQLGAYLLVLDCISFRIEQWARFSFIDENKARQMLGTISTIKNSLSEGRVIEDPVDTLKRIDALTQMSIA